VRCGLVACGKRRRKKKEESKGRERRRRKKCFSGGKKKASRVNRLLLGEAAAGVLDDNVGGELGSLEGLLNRLAKDKLAEESTDKGVTGTVGVDDQGGVDLLDGVLSNLALGGHNGGLGAVGDDHNSAPLGVDLGKGGDLEGDLAEVLVLPALGLTKGGGLVLIAEDHVPVRGSGEEGVLEELHDEGGGEVHDKDLVILGGVLGNPHNGGGRDSEEEATNVIGLGLLDEGPDLGSGEVVLLVLVGGEEIGDHGAVPAGNENGAKTGGDLVILKVLGPDTVGGGGRPENLCQFNRRSAFLETHAQTNIKKVARTSVLVLANTSNKGNRARLREDPLEEDEEVSHTHK